MRLKSLILLFAITVPQYSGYSQKTSSYDRIFSETAQVLVASNPKKALQNTDYLYRISNNNLERIKACMLKATLLRQYGVLNEAINTLKRADSLSLIDADYYQQARINGFMSTIYREYEIYSLGKAHLQKAVNASKKMKNKSEMYKFQGNLSQEIAYYEMYNSNYSKAITCLKAGNKLFEKAGSATDKNFQMAVNDELIAKNYLPLHKIDSALYFYNKAMKELQASQSANSPLRGFIYNGFANVYTSTGDNTKALYNFKMAEEIAEASNFFALKQEIYNSLMEFYKKTDTKKYIKYNELNLKLHKDEEHSRKIIADELIKTLRKKQLANQSNYQKSKLIIISSCVFIVLLTIGMYVYKRKKDYKLENSITESEPLPHIEKQIIAKKDSTREYMSVTTENSILKSLKELEKSHFYLNKDISLNSVAAELSINQRYLSYVINKHSTKDFAGYINELRINYIIDRLKNDDSYLKYKISYLADLSGFSSHSRFTVTFKKVTGISPMNFINHLQEEKNGNEKS